MFEAGLLTVCLMGQMALGLKGLHPHSMENLQYYIDLCGALRT